MNNKYLLLLLLSVFGFPAFAQILPQPYVTAIDGVALCGPGDCTTLTADYFSTGQTTSYTVATIPYNPPFGTIGANVIPADRDDQWTDIINLGFPFCFYGNSYDKVMLTSNGAITFSIAGLVPQGRYSPNTPSTWVMQGPIPYAAPNNTLAPFVNSIFGVFHDIDPAKLASNPKISWSILGAYPNRVLVFNIKDVLLWNCGTALPPQNSQLVMYETTNVIEVFVGNRNPCMTWENGKGLIGLQNIDGTQAIAAPGRNVSTWSATNEGWRFTPAGPSIVTLDWFEGTTLVGTGPSATVCPTVDTTYKVRATYNLCSGPPVIVEDFIDVDVPDPLPLGPIEDIILCGDQPTYTVDIKAINDAILGTLDPNINELTVHPTQVAQIAGSGSIPTSVLQNYPVNQGQEYTIWVRIQDYFTSCVTLFSYKVKGGVQPVATAPQDMHVCDVGNDGIEIFDLTSNDGVILGTQDPNDFPVSYHTTATGADDNTDIISATNAAAYSSGNATIYVRVSNAETDECFAVTDFDLVVTPSPQVVAPADGFACSDVGYTLPVLTVGNYFTASNGGGTQLNAGDILHTSQTVYVYSQSGTAPNICSNEDSFEITIYNSPIVDKPADIQVCGSFVLEPLNVGNYYTQPAGAGVIVPAGTEITATQTFYIYAQTGAGVVLCTDEHAYTVTINAAPAVSPATPLEACADNFDNLAYFNLTTAGTEILNGQTGLTLTYHLTEVGAEFGTTPITGDLTNYYTTVPMIWASVIQTGTTTNCRTVVPIQLIVHPRPAIPVMTNYALCDTNNSPDGIEVFDLTTKDAQATGGNGTYTVSYYLSQAAAQAGTGAIPTPAAHSNTASPNDQVIWVRVETALGCVSIASFHIIVNPLPVINPNLDTFYACEQVPGEGEFNLDQIAIEVVNGAAGYVVTFYETLAQAQLGGTDNETSLYLSATTTIYARVSDIVTGCFTITPVDLEVIPAPIAAVPAPLEICDSNNDGFGVYNLDPVIQAIQTALGNVVVTVHETPEDADFNTNKITVTNAYDSSHLTIQTLYIRVQSGQTVCYDVVELKLIANPTPVAVTPSPYALCDDGASDTDGQAVFNLSTKANEVLGTLDPALYSVSYYTDAAATIMIGNPVTHLSGSTEVYIKVSNNATGCFTVVKLKLIVNALPTAVQPTAALRLCDVTAPLKDGIEIFDLTSVIPSIIGAQQGINVTFHHSYAAAQSNTGAIAAPNAYPSGPAVETVFVRVTVEATGCYRIVLQDLKVEPLPEILRPTQDALTVCDTDGNGIGEFNLFDLVDAMKNGEPNLEVTFHHTLEDAQNGDNPIGNTTEYINTDPYLEFIYVRVVNTVTGCVNSEVYQLRLIVEPAVQAPALGALSLCDEDANNQDLKTFFNLSQQDAVIYTALNAAPGSLTIYYFIDEASARAGAPRITTPGNYLGSDAQVIWVRVQGANGCFSVTSFVLKVNRPLLLTTPTMLTLCNEVLPNDGQAVFDLTVKNNEILGPLGVGKGYTVAYYESNPKTNPLASPIADPTAYTNPAPPAGNPKTLYVVVTSKEGCRSYTTLTIKVLPLPMPDTSPDALVMCNEDNSVDGKEAFDLTKAEADIRNNDNQSLITYHSTLADAEAGINKIAVPTAYLSATGSVWVRMEANTNNPSDPKCYQVVELNLIVNPLPAIGDANGNVPPYAICEPNTNGFADFDLNSHIEKILGTNSAADYDIEFYLDQAALDAGTALPRLYTNVVANSQTILVLVTNKATGCSITKPLQLLVEESAIANPIIVPFDECDTEGANDGKITWDLTQADSQVLGGQNPADYKVSYYTSLADAEAGVNAIPVPAAYLNAVPGGETIWVRVTNTATISKCHDITTIELIVELLPEPKIQGGTICVDKITDEVLRSYEITTGLDASHLFVWSDDKGVIPGETGPSLIVSKPGNYSVVATSATGCVSAPVTPVEVIQSGPASKVGVGYYVSNAFSDVQTITVEVEGYGVYQYKLDEGPWQDSPVFTDVSRGEHKVTVRDVKTANPCDDLVIEGASVIDYPNFFTPNGDGFHDTWNIVGLQGSGAVIYIFDRYGKLMKQISPDENGGWDGTFNGSPVPATDYWFTVTYPETVGSTGVTVNKEFKAHFSLKR